MSYTRPPVDQADATWQGAAEYTRPAHDAADATWQPPGPALITAWVQVPGPLGAPTVLADQVLPDSVFAIVAVPSPLGAPAVRAAPVVQGRASVPGPLGVPNVRAFAVPVARVAVPSPLGVPAVAATVLRFELRGVVRDGGVLVNRRVRAYRLDTGEMVGESDTAAGAFVIHAGFTAREHYLLPLDFSPEAADYAPPCANRVLSVLAMDEVAP